MKPVVHIILPYSPTYLKVWTYGGDGVSGQGIGRSSCPDHQGNIYANNVDLYLSQSLCVTIRLAASE